MGAPPSPGERRLSPAAAPRAGAPRLGRPFAAIVLVALIARVVVILATPDFVPVTDAIDYDRTAATLLDTGSWPTSEVFSAPHGPTAYRPPGFPLALAAVYGIVGTGDAQTRWDAGRVLEALLGALAVALIGAIAARLWGRGAALIAAGIAAVYPPLLLVGSSLLSEPLFIALILGAVLATLRHREDGGLRWAAIAGALIGLCALTRGNGIALALPLALAVSTGRPRRRALRAPLTLLAVCALTLVPWTLRNARTLHSFVPLSTETGYVLAGTYTAATQHSAADPAFWMPPRAEVAAVLSRAPRDNEAQVSSRLESRAIEYIRAHPGSLARTAYWTALRLLDLTGTGFERALAPFEGFPRGLTEWSVYGFWLLALLAIAGAFTRAARAAPRALWGCPAVLLASMLLLFGTTRYRAPADPFLVMLAALALEAGHRRLRRSRLPSAAQ